MNESVLYIVLQREIFIEHFVNIFVDVKKKKVIVIVIKTDIWILSHVVTC